MKHRIGLVYVPGSLPCFENFGSLPTDLVREDGLVLGKPASDVLDMLIIPGGSLVESQTIRGELSRQILEMADKGKTILGICSGFQILSRGTDIGRLSPTPIFKTGLKLLDVEFKPLICTDQVQADIVGDSNLTREVGAKVRGFHCHTYGDISVYKNAKLILVSHVNRLNYAKQPQKLVSGACNSEGNVIGILPHALLDKNPTITKGITEALGIDPTELSEIRAKNFKLQTEIKAEIGISTNIHAEKTTLKTQNPRALLITALESGGGKTFIATGLAAALKKRRFHVGLIKIGGDIRDIVPALYMVKEPMKDYSSIVVAETGWKSPNEVARKANKDYEFTLIEGAMNTFTGIFFDQYPKPNSTVEVAGALGVPTIVVAGCDKEGIEGGIVSALSYVRFLRKLGINVAGVVLNKVYLNYLNEGARNSVIRAFADSGADLLGLVPVTDVEGRGAIPEIEIKYEDFGAKALQEAEQSLNIDRIIEVAGPLKTAEFDYEAFVEKFKNTLTHVFSPT